MASPPANTNQAMERQVVWNGRRYRKTGGMERQVVWNGRWYGTAGGMERQAVWNGRCEEIHFVWFK
jgi:hypothetical protein